jgi:hypothetical protein
MGLRGSDRHLHHIGGLRPLGALHDIEFDVFSLFQGFEPFPLKRGVMHEHILSAIQTDESKTLTIIEPLHRSFRLHRNPPFLNGHGYIRDRARAPLIHTADMMKETNENDDWERMGGLLEEKKTYSRDPSWLQIALHVTQGFKSCQGNLWHASSGVAVDKAGGVPYSAR